MSEMKGTAERKGVFKWYFERAACFNLSMYNFLGNAFLAHPPTLMSAFLVFEQYNTRRSVFMSIFSFFLAFPGLVSPLDKNNSMDVLIIFNLTYQCRHNPLLLKAPSNTYGQNLTITSCSEYSFTLWGLERYCL